MSPQSTIHNPQSTIHNTYIAQTQPGFEAIAAEEIAARIEGARLRGTRAVADKNGMVLFEYAGDPRDLFGLRTIEDLFVLVAALPNLPPTAAGLRLLRDAAASASLDPALQLSRQISPGRGGRGKLRFRVVARQVGQAAYRRVDAQRAVERAILGRADHRWSLEDEGALELWLTLLPGEALLALRLSDERMRHRDYKIDHLPASLRPSAAAALAWLTRPAPDDVFLDPMCGAGTILIERAHAGRYALLLGGDIRAEALAVARANVGPRYKPIELREWDARELPIDAGSISAAAVNLPFGRQIGSAEENRALYPATLRELARVLRPGARLAVLTGDRRTFDETLRRARGLARRQVYPVQVLGQPAAVYLIERA
ncbi:MAG: TRM11 family SAM-dependent methyltransferase [Roseiflexaceae bacterium]